MAKKKVETDQGNTLASRYLAKTKSSAYLLRDNKFPIRDWIDSGNYVLNALISADWRKGYPTGRIIQLAGPNSVGKSYLCLMAMIQAQKMGYLVYLADAEFGGDTNNYIERGLDPDKIIHNPLNHIKTTTGELMSFINEVKPEEKAIIVIDSLGNLSSLKETEDIGSFSDKRDMTRAQEIKAMFRQLVVPAGSKNVPIFIVNHEYMTTDMYAKKVQSGGTGPAYGSSIILSMNKKKEKENNEIIGSGMICANNKNRFAKENESVKLLIHYDHGLNRFCGLFDIAIEMGYIIKKGGFYSIDGDSTSYRKKDIYYNEEMWMKALNGSFGDSLNKKFKYQSQTSDLFFDEDDDIMEE